MRATIFEVIVWSGAAVTLAGLALLMWCIVRALRLRGAAIDEAARRAGLARLIPVNFGALALSFLGLVLVLTGVILG